MKTNDNGTVTVRMLKARTPYQIGELVGFEPGLAESLVKAGVATDDLGDAVENGNVDVKGTIRDNRATAEGRAARQQDVTPIGGERPIEIQHAKLVDDPTEDAAAKSRPDATSTPLASNAVDPAAELSGDAGKGVPLKVDVPEKWMEMTADEKKALAGTISGKTVATAKEAEAIIKEHGDDTAGAKG